MSQQAVGSEQEYFNWASTQIQDINVLRFLHGIYYSVLQSCASNNFWRTPNRQAGKVKRAISHIVIIYEAEISEAKKKVFDMVALIISGHKEKAEFEVTQCTKNNKTKKATMQALTFPLVLSSALTHPVTLSVPEKASNMLNEILQWKERFFQTTWIASNEDEPMMRLILLT